jgi:hypothetical protein
VPVDVLVQEVAVQTMKNDRMKQVMVMWFGVSKSRDVQDHLSMLLRENMALLQ